MNGLKSYVDVIEQQVELLSRLSEETGDWEEKRAYESARQRMSELKDAIEAHEEQAESGGVYVSSVSIEPDFNEIEDLPEELQNELSFKPSGTDYQIPKIINDNGGIASLDKILIELYKRTGEVTKRSRLSSKIYRLTNKEFVFPVPGKKGVYSTKNLSEKQVAQLFG